LNLCSKVLAIKYCPNCMMFISFENFWKKLHYNLFTSSKQLKEILQKLKTWYKFWKILSMVENGSPIWLCLIKVMAFWCFGTIFVPIFGVCPRSFENFPFQSSFHEKLRSIQGREWSLSQILTIVNPMWVHGSSILNQY
jgi:hypothetical protein